MQKVVRDIWNRLSHPLTLVVCTSLSIVCAVSGPFETSTIMGFWARLYYWTLICFGSTLVAYIAHALIDCFIGFKRPLISEVLSLGLMVALISPFVYGTSLLLTPFACFRLACFAEIGFYVALVALVVFLVRRVIPGLERVNFLVPQDDGSLSLVSILSDEVAEPDPFPRPRLYRRLPDDETGDILHMTANGHFVQVTTTDGRHSIRIRFADAIDEMDGVAGVCTHRSHWVVISAVTGNVRVGGKPVLTLSNGMQVPVSRTYQPDVEAAGLLPSPREDVRSAL